MADNGCLHYVHGTLDIYFDPAAVDCDHCPVLETYARKQCRRTGEYLVNSKLTGWNCPIKFDEGETNT
jgi:hypothetical protein